MYTEKWIRRKFVATKWDELHVCKDCKVVCVRQWRFSVMQRDRLRMENGRKLLTTDLATLFISKKPIWHTEPVSILANLSFLIPRMNEPVNEFRVRAVHFFSLFFFFFFAVCLRKGHLKSRRRESMDASFVHSRHRLKKKNFSRTILLESKCGYISGGEFLLYEIDWSKKRKEKLKRRFVLRFKRGKQFLDLKRKVWKIVENEKIPWNGTNECVETTLWHLYHFSQIGGGKVFFQSDEQYEKVELFRFIKICKCFVVFQRISRRKVRIRNGLSF